MPVAWDLRAWPDANVWESEDGPTRHRLCQRWYHWDTPMRWIDPTHLAVSGLDDDDEATLPGVRIFDVTTGDEVRAFVGQTAPPPWPASTPPAGTPGPGSWPRSPRRSSSAGPQYPRRPAEARTPALRVPSRGTLTCRRAGRGDRVAVDIGGHALRSGVVLRMREPAAVTSGRSVARLEA
jgi:hypothetical protein